MNKEDAVRILSRYNNSAKLFSLAGRETWARVVELYDADTMKVVFPFQTDDVHKIIVRVRGVDAPEIKSENETIKNWTIKARNRMLSLVAPGVFEVDGTYSKKDIVRLLRENVAVVWLHLFETDKFGRTLGDLFYSPEDTNKTIQSICVDENFCKPYFGKTKSLWNSDDCKQNDQL